MRRTGPVLQRILIQNAADEIDERVSQKGAGWCGGRERCDTPSNERPREAVCLERRAETDLVGKAARVRLWICDRLLRAAIAHRGGDLMDHDGEKDDDTEVAVAAPCRCAESDAVRQAAAQRAT